MACNLQSSFVSLSHKSQYNVFLFSKLVNICGFKNSVACSNSVVYSASVSPSTSAGRFGKYGGKYVPELLMTSLSILEHEFHKALNDVNFQEELATAMRDYVGRETPLYYAKRVTQHYKDKQGRGPEIYLKREDLNHSGAYKINNAIAQVMLAKRMGCNIIVTATGASHHGVATAAASAKLGLKCIVFMGRLDIQRQPSCVALMELLGAQVNSVNGNYKFASAEAIREWVNNIETNYYHLQSSIVGPHPCPTMVREFQSVIGKEVRKQAMQKWGGKPDVLVACVGDGSNAMGLFHEFIEDKEVRLVGVEAAGAGLETGRHSAKLAKGSVGVYQGTMSYLLQDDEGNIVDPYSIAVGLESPAVGPELSYLKDNQRAEFYAVTDEEALQAYKRLCSLEGIFPAIEASHALGFLEKLCPTLPHGTKVVVSCSGQGDMEENHRLVAQTAAVQL